MEKLSIPVRKSATIEEMEYVLVCYISEQFDFNMAMFLRINKYVDLWLQNKVEKKTKHLIRY